MIDPAEFERCLVAGGLVVFPVDTVYGIGCDPWDGFAVERLYLLKRRQRCKPCAVMFFDLELMLCSLPELGPRTRAALTRLMPGSVGALLPNPRRRFPFACGEDSSTLGVRVPAVEALAQVRRPVLQSSANRAGGPDPRTLDEVPELLRAAADLVLDGGQLPGTPSTLVDLRRYEHDRSWAVVRAGAVGQTQLEEVLHGEWQSDSDPFDADGDDPDTSSRLAFDPDVYPEMIRAEIPAFDRLQDELVAASGGEVARVLELGTGTGETARRLLARHRNATLIGIDQSASMLSAAREVLGGNGVSAAALDSASGGDRVELRVGRLEDPLPTGPFDLVVSALTVHHLSDEAKADLFGRVHDVLRPEGRFVLADVVVPVDRADAVTPLTPGFDRPSSVEDQLEWLRAAGFAPSVAWQQQDLAVIVADAVYRRGR